ncbi:MAG TPA: hypothetical protein VKA09_13010 [Nitrososphaeraceae archaeon]|nr:hypothetical protein [Nitrososphaeraceae archaeon]
MSQPHQKQEDKQRDRVNRLLMYLNDALAMENASAERLQSRIKETDIEELKNSTSKTSTGDEATAKKARTDDY